MSVLHQFAGHKLVTLFSPDQSHLLYPNAQCSTLTEYGTRFSAVEDITNPDLLRYPLFAKAKRLEVLLAPGEMIYIPSGWWHHVKVVTSSISVASRSYTPCEGLSYVPNFLVAWANREWELGVETFCIVPGYITEAQEYHEAYHRQHGIESALLREQAAMRDVY